jgi:surface protein
MIKTIIIDKKKILNKLLLFMLVLFLFLSVFGVIVNCSICNVLAAEIETYTATYDTNVAGTFGNGIIQNMVVYEVPAQAIEAVVSDNCEESKPTNLADRFVGLHTTMGYAEGNELDSTTLASNVGIYDKYNAMTQLYSGTCGTCSWIIYEDGLLRIYPTNGESGTLASNTNNSSQFWPWYSHNNYITSVIIEDGVSGGTSLHKMFNSCKALTSVDLSGFNTTNVTDMSYMFYYCESLTSVDLSSWDTNNTITISDMFSLCSSLTDIDLSGWNTANVKNMSSVFYSCKSLISLNISGWNTSNVDDMSYMFSGCCKLTSEEMQRAIANIDTGNVAAMNNLFDSCEALTSLDLSSCNTSNATDMSYMLYGCELLNSLNISGWDTRNVNNMSKMFSHCYKLPSGEMKKIVENLNTISVTAMSDMFFSCSSLTSLDLSSWNVNNVTNMANMFSDCISLTTLNISGWNTSNVIKMSYMFSSCPSLNTIVFGDDVVLQSNCHLEGKWMKIKNADGANTNDETKYSASEIVALTSQTTPTLGGTWTKVPIQYSGTMTGGVSWEITGDALLKIYPTNGVSGTLPNNTNKNNKFWPWYQYSQYITSAVVMEGVIGSDSINGMFYYCSHLKSIDLSGLDTSNVTDMSDLFFRCKSLTSEEAQKTIAGLDIQNVTNMNDMFSDCSSLTTLDLSDWDVSNVTDMSYMFSSCSSLTTLNINGWDTSNVIDMSYMFSYDSSLTDEEMQKIIANLDTSSVVNMFKMFANCYSLTSLNLRGLDTHSVTDMGSMFYYCNELNRLDLSGWDTNNVTNMSSMFYECRALSDIDCSGWNTNNVKNMSQMFYRCEALTNLDLSGWNTSSLTSMYQMFYECKSLIMVNLCGWNTSQISDMNQIFYSCESLTSLNLNSFNTDKVTDMNAMFHGCKLLTSLDLSRFDTSKVTDMGNMFRDCNSLASLNISGWDTSSVIYMSSMFDGCTSLTTLDLNGFDTSKANMSYMFQECRKLSKITFGENFAFRGTFHYFEDAGNDWIKVRNADGRKTYDDNKYTAAQIAALNNTNSTPLLGGVWIKNYQGDEYITNADGSIEYISDDSYWIIESDTVWKYVFTVFDDTLEFKLFEEMIENYSSAAMEPYYIEIKHNQAIVENRLSSNEYGKLKISKTVEGNSLADDDFEFTIILSGIDISGTKIFNNVVFENGLGRFTLKSNESKTFELPVGAKYSVSEKKYKQYTNTITNGTGVIEKDITQSVVVVNTYIESPAPETGGVNLTLKKTVSENCDTSKEFYISGYFTNLEANKTYIVSDGSSFISNEKGVAFYDAVLCHPEEIVFYSLPIGATYQFTEHENEYIGSVSVRDVADSNQVLKQESTNKESGMTISTNVETIVEGENILVHFHSDTIPLQDLIIVKNVKKETANNQWVDYVTDETFEFTIIFSNMQTAMSFSSDIGKIVADEHGEASKTFYLKSGERICFYDIPKDVQYIITESANDYIASYEIAGIEVTNAANKNTSNKQQMSTEMETIDANENNLVLFTNLKGPDMVPVAIRKVDDKGNMLTDAVLQILDAENNVVVEFTTTNNDYIVDLLPGAYTLHEISAPSGYAVAEDIEFSVVVGNENIVTMIDKPIAVLTSTGGSGAFITVIMAIALSTLAAMCIYVAKKKSKEISQSNGK